MLPLDMMADYGKIIGYLTFFLIGFGFGAVLENAGFGDSRKLAAQFYFKDMTVLKTMFTGIIVASILIFFTSSLGYLDFSKIFVNQTYLWPGIVGGLIMGFGFITGGYCPGTSVVSAASLKIDGIVFLVGTLIGVGLFGETVSYFSDFWNSSYTELYLLSDWMNFSIGATLVSVTILALVLFYGAEKAEEYFRNNGKISSWKITNRRYLISASVVLIMAGLTWAIGQPDPERRWNYWGTQYQSLLDNREVFIHPLEYVKTWNDAAIKLETLDLRAKDDFEKFHLDSAKNISTEALKDAGFVSQLLRLPAQGVVVLISDNEEEAVQAWKWLKAQGVTNLYILEDGIKNWLNTFIDKEIPHKKLDLTRPPMDILEMFSKDTFKAKIKLKTNKRGGGLCS